jgi:hypothetical protein
MATSYTSLLGFALPVTGELQGTWGDTVNNSITQLCEDSIAGVATVSVTSADWTLTTTGSGAANQARMAILIPTGTPGVSRNIIAPSKSKTYTVINQSNAAVVLKGAATTGVTIAAGDKVVVVWNGSDFVSLVTTNAAGVFTTLSASSTVTLSGGTANGVAYLNGSKVLTTGSGLVFDGTNLGIGTSSPSQKLTVRGGRSVFQANSDFFSIQIEGGSGAGQRYIGATNELFPSMLFSNSSGTEQMRVTNDGNVGIGTSSPSASAILDAQSTTKGVRFPNMTTTQKNAISSPAAGLVVFDTTLSKLCIYTGAAWQTITSV